MEKQVEQQADKLWRPDPGQVYGSVRTEILEQKKCQFQLFGAALTVTSAVLAFGARPDSTHLVYLGAIVMNVVSSWMILDKAMSIQRMVGYLQLMESVEERREWRWEFHLDKFRGISKFARGSDDGRKHKYVRNVAITLFALAVLCCALIILPRVPMSCPPWYTAVGVDGWLGIGLVVAGAIMALNQWRQLVRGDYSGVSVKNRWMEVLKLTPADMGPPNVEVNAAGLKTDL